MFMGVFTINLMAGANDIAKNPHDQFFMGGVFTMKNGWFMTLLYHAIPTWPIYGGFCAHWQSRRAAPELETKVHHAAGLCRCGRFVAKPSAVFEHGNGASSFLTLFRLSTKEIPRINQNLKAVHNCFRNIMGFIEDVFQVADEWCALWGGLPRRSLPCCCQQGPRISPMEDPQETSPRCRSGISVELGPRNPPKNDQTRIFYRFLAVKIVFLCFFLVEDHKHGGWSRYVMDVW